MAGSYYRGGPTGPIEQLGVRPPLHIVQSRPPATVAVVADESELGYMIINASDFDERVHVHYVESEAQSPASARRRK